MYQLMIVDDREIFRRKFKRFPVFQNNPFFEIAFEASNGEEALQILRRNKVDVVITDIRMPIMNGLELLAEIRREELCGCIVMLSEYADFSYAREGIVLGAFDYWVKPIQEEKLSEDMERIFQYLQKNHNHIQVAIPELSILPKAIAFNDEYLEDILLTVCKKLHDATAEEETNIGYQLREIYQKEIVPKIIRQHENLKDFLLFEQYQCKQDDEWEKEFVLNMQRLANDISRFALWGSHELIQNICRDILADIEKNISLEMYAERYHISKTYLSYLFKKEVGNSFVKYVTEVKIARAKVLLWKSDKKIYEISTSLSFDDTEYFSRIFKSITGMTPSSFRKNNLLGDEND